VRNSVGAILAAVLIGACTSPGSPSHPERTSPRLSESVSFVEGPVTVRLSAEASKAAEDSNVDLTSLMRAAIRDVSRRLDLRKTRVSVRVSPKRTIRSAGVGGFTDPVTGRVALSLDPDHPKFDRVLQVWLPATVAHELHHSVRIKRGPGYGETLLEAIVTEGLAQVFSREVVADAPILPDAVSGPAVCRLWADARRESRVGAYDHYAWFFGTQEIPKWTGYTLGHELIQSYLVRRPPESAASLVECPARMIISEAGFCR